MTINIDKFRDTVTVEMGGKKYNLEAFIMQEYINDDKFDPRKYANTQEFYVFLIDLLASRSDIPRDLLVLLTSTQISTLLGAMRGVDPEKLDNRGDSGKK